MVQPGVNPFPGSPGFPATAALNSSDGNIPMAVAVKNDPLASSNKPDVSVSISPSISVAQVSPTGRRPRPRPSPSHRRDFAPLQTLQSASNQYSPALNTQVSQASGQSSLALPLPTATIMSTIDNPAVSTGAQPNRARRETKRERLRLSGTHSASEYSPK